MGRKKKNIVATPQEHIGYKGEVTISVAHGREVKKVINVHNEGQKPLFEFIRYCLAGAYVTSKLPRYIRLFTKPGDVETDVTTRPILANQTVSYTETDTTASVTLNFIVPYSLLKTGTDIKIIKLYSEENSRNVSKPSATIEITNPITISESSNLLVAWKMTIGNYVEQGE